MPKIEIKGEYTREIEVYPEDFEEHGQWMDGNRTISKMWEHVPTGKMFYENVEEVVDRNLLIYPF